MLESLYIDGAPLLEPSNGDNWLVPDITGLDAPTYRQSLEDRAGEDGAFMHGEHYGHRVIGLPGVLQASDSSTLGLRRRELIALCAIQRDNAGRPIPKRFTGTTLDGEVIFFDAFTRAPVFGTESPNWCSFLITAVAPDYNIYLDTAVSSGQITVLSSGGAIYPVTYPVNYGSTSGGSVAIYNAGTADVYPVITLRGGLSGPVIFHSDRGVSLSLNYNLGASDTVVIDMMEKTITLNGTSNLMAYRTSDSDWFSVAPGSNPIRLETASTGDTGSMEIGFNPALLGI